MDGEKLPAVLQLPQRAELFRLLVVSTLRLPRSEIFMFWMFMVILRGWVESNRPPPRTTDSSNNHYGAQSPTRENIACMCTACRDRVCSHWPFVGSSYTTEKLLTLFRCYLTHSWDPVTGTITGTTTPGQSGPERMVTKRYSTSSKTSEVPQTEVSPPAVV